MVLRDGDPPLARFSAEDELWLAAAKEQTNSAKEKDGKPWKRCHTCFHGLPSLNPCDVPSNECCRPRLRPDRSSRG